MGYIWMLMCTIDQHMCICIYGLTLIIHRSANWVSLGHYTTEWTAFPQTQRPGKQKNIKSKRVWVNVVSPAGHLSKLGRCLQNGPDNQGEDKHWWSLTVCFKSTGTGENFFFQSTASLWLSNAKTRQNSAIYLHLQAHDHSVRDDAASSSWTNQQSAHIQKNRINPKVINYK